MSYIYVYCICTIYIHSIGKKIDVSKTILLKTTTIYMIKIHLCDVFVKSIPREGFTTFMVKGLSRIEYGSGMDSLTLVPTCIYTLCNRELSKICTGLFWIMHMILHKPLISKECLAPTP